MTMQVDYLIQACIVTRGTSNNILQGAFDLYNKYEEMPAAGKHS